MSIQENISRIKAQIPKDVQLIAVSKFHPIQTVMEAYNYGQRVFGENRVQEVCEKYDKMPKDINWHFIGHLQTNKVKYIIPFIYCIHSIDSIKLLKEVNKEAIKQNRIIPCLLQVHIAKEIHKFGFTEQECLLFFKENREKEFPNIKFIGLMGMSTKTDDKNQISKEFKTLKDLFENIKSNYLPLNKDFSELSMGMTNDFNLAIEQGSTMIRVGSAIFGERQY